MSVAGGGARAATGFRGVARRALRLAATACDWSRDASGVALVHAAAPDASVAAFLGAERAAVARELRSGGALLLRGFAVPTLDDFRRAVRTGGGAPLAYEYASTPRTGLGGGVFTATDYPADQTIPLHNELSYAAHWPSLLWLHCRRPAAAGGATPLADARRVLARIPRDVRERFAARGVRYVRNHGGGLDLPLDAVFGTIDRRAIEAFCRREGIAWRWRDDGGLTTWRVGPATTAHPRTGEQVWFNQAHLFHPSSLEPEVRDALAAGLAPDDLPRNACYGDGGAIEDEALAAIREAYGREERRFAWRAGDVVVLDNVLVAHGRDPFRGAREVVVAMTHAAALDAGGAGAA